MEQVWNGFRVEAAQESCTIRRYEGGAERVCVPERLGGLPVKSIGGGAFAGQVQLREVILPDSVTVIDHHAFAGCTSLTRLHVGHGLQAMGAHALDGCTALTELALPGTLRLLLDGVFAGCSALRRLSLPQGTMAAMGPGCFEGCHVLMTPVRLLTRAEADALPPVLLAAPDGEPSLLREVRPGRCYAEPRRAVMTLLCEGVLRAGESGAEQWLVPEKDWILEKIG